MHSKMARSSGGQARTRAAQPEIYRTVGRWRRRSSRLKRKFSHAWPGSGGAWPRDHESQEGHTVPVHCHVEADQAERAVGSAPRHAQPACRAAFAMPASNSGTLLTLDQSRAPYSCSAPAHLHVRCDGALLHRLCAVALLRRREARACGRLPRGGPAGRGRVALPPALLHPLPQLLHIRPHLCTWLPYEMHRAT